MDGNGYTRSRPTSTLVDDSLCFFFISSLCFFNGSNYLNYSSHNAVSDAMFSMHVSNLKPGPRVSMKKRKPKTVCEGVRESLPISIEHVLHAETSRARV